MVEILQLGEYVYAVENYTRTPASREKVICEFILAYNKEFGRVPTIKTAARGAGVENHFAVKRFYEFLKSEGYIYVPRNKDGNSMALHMMKDELRLQAYASGLT